MDLLHVDRHLIHDLGGARGLLAARNLGHAVQNPELAFATADHSVSSKPGRRDDRPPISGNLSLLCRFVHEVSDARRGIDAMAIALAARSIG